MVFASLPPALGNAHLMLLHLPVGFAVAAALLEVWTWRDAAGRAVVVKLLATNALLALLTAAAGLVLAEQGDYPENALNWHRWAGVACALVAVAAWWLRARRGVAAGRAGIVALLIATTLAGHLGATLTHGDGLLAWSSRPPQATRLAGEDAARGEAVGDPAAGVLSEVHPLLEKHCVECHGPEKQKGRLRLDTLAAARAAGKSGERGVVPGDATASEILRRVELSRDDDEAMPPGERTPLTATERAELTAWVTGLAR
jgi:uncharacterized membrane protein